MVKFRVVNRRLTNRTRLVCASHHKQSFYYLVLKFKFIIKIKREAFKQPLKLPDKRWQYMKRGK